MLGHGMNANDPQRKLPNDARRGITRAGKQNAAPVEALSPASQDLAALPPRVAALRAKILDAVASDNIENLLIPIEWNEVPPMFETGSRQPQGFAQIIPYLKARSFDGQGREWLSVIEAVFTAPYIRVTRGVFVTYVWPSFALTPLPLTGDEEGWLALWRCVRFADLMAHDAKGRPLIQHAGIGADGTWHYLWAEPVA
jgi:hypothetical protein